MDNKNEHKLPATIRPVEFPEDMHTVEGKEFGGERALFATHRLRLEDATFHAGESALKCCSDIDIDRYHQDGNYSFQYCRNVVVHNAVINSRDAFWETENVTVYNSEINGEYLGWHSKGLHLVRCKINGTQPLCYCQGLVLEDCTFGDECDLAFEDSDLTATVNSSIVSVKNPRTGSVKAFSIGEVIIDKNVLAPNDCKITTEV